MSSYAELSCSAWSEDQLDVIKKFYVRWGAERVAQRLQRSIQSVRNCAYRLGINRRERQGCTCVCGEHAWLTLSKGHCAFISPNDLERANQRIWSASRATSHAGPYARATPVLLHRFITSAPDGMVVDHLDGDTLNNRRDNLRVCTQAQNMQNIRTAPRTECGFKGVYRAGTPERPRWGARVKHNGEAIYLGVFETAESAASAYDKWAIANRGAHVRLNIPADAPASPEEVVA